MSDRPPREQRLLSDRSTPAVITIRTQFAYNTHDAPSGRPPRVARYHSRITNCGEFNNQTTHDDHLGDVFHRMIAAFGDDTDLEVIVRPIAHGSDRAAQQNEQADRELR